MSVGDTGQCVWLGLAVGEWIATAVRDESVQSANHM